MKRHDWPVLIATCCLLAFAFLLWEWLDDDCTARGGVLRAYAGCLAKDVVR